MKSSSSEDMRDRRIAAAALLRESDGKNKERLLHIHDILNGPSYIPQESNSIPDTKPPQDSISNTFRRSFVMRLLIALLITFSIYTTRFAENPQIHRCIHKLKTTITTDYSENLFDFIQQIPYTLEYEKINVEG